MLGIKINLKRVVVGGTGTGTGTNQATNQIIFNLIPLIYHLKLLF